MTKDEPKLTLRINGKEFAGWESIEVQLHLDTFSSVSVSAPFDPDSKDQRDAFRPYGYQRVEVLADGEPLFTGTMLAPSPSSDASSSVVTAEAYSLPGVLGDCPLPAVKLPSEFKGLKLAAIAQAVTAPFGISTTFEADSGAVFEKAKLEADEQVFSFLVKLAQQRSLIFSSTPEGALLCRQAKTSGRPVARLVDGTPPVLGVAPSFDPQSYFSEITGFGKTKKTSKKAAASYTVSNDFLSGVLRPSNFRADDTVAGDLPTATKAKLGRMFANTASFTVELATWRDPLGAIWKDNELVTLLAPRAMVYTESELLIRSVVLKQDASSSTASLGLVLPGAYSGVLPSSLPWED